MATSDEANIGGDLYVWFVYLPPGARYSRRAGWLATAYFSCLILVFLVVAKRKT
jgi:hypothetical protein